MKSPETSNLQPSVTHIKLCPFWRRVVVMDDKILALCGSKSKKEPPQNELDFGERLSSCPWNAHGIAYMYPAILEVQKGKEPSYLILASKSGNRGIIKLERLWEKYVADFIEKHFQAK